MGGRVVRRGIGLIIRVGSTTSDGMLWLSSGEDSGTGCLPGVDVGCWVDSGCIVGERESCLCTIERDEVMSMLWGLVSGHGPSSPNPAHFLFLSSCSSLSSLSVTSIRSNSSADQTKWLLLRAILCCAWKIPSSVRIMSFLNGIPC